MEEKQEKKQEPEFKGKMGTVWLVGILVIILGCVTVYTLGMLRKNGAQDQVPTEPQTVAKVEEQKEEPAKVESTINEEKKEETANQKENVKSTVIKTLKKYLLDDEWIKDNLYIEKDLANEKVKKSETQNLTFNVIRDKITSYPAVIIKTELKDRIGAELYLLTYVSNKIIVKSITDGVVHPEHNVLLSNNSYVAVEYAHMGDWNYEIYTLSNGNLKEEKKGKGQLKDNESDYLELNAITEKYNLKEITTVLNKTNIDKYIK